MAMSERWRVWSETMLTRFGIALLGPGIGFLIVVALRQPDLSSPFAQSFGGVGLASIFLGLLLLVVSWFRTTPADQPSTTDSR